MTKRTNKSNARVLVLALILLALGGVAFALKINSDGSPKTSVENARGAKTSSPTPSTTSSAQAQKTSTGSSAAGIPVKSAEPTQTPAAAPKPFYVGVDIKETSVNVDYQLPQIADGKCTARFTKAGATTVTGVNTTAQATNYSACKTISIPKSSFSQLGEWNLTVTFEGNGKSAESDSRIIKVY